MRIVCALLAGLVTAAVVGCDGKLCADGEVPNDALQACVIAVQCDGGVVTERNECVRPPACDGGVVNERNECVRTIEVPVLVAPDAGVARQPATKSGGAAGMAGMSMPERAGGAAPGPSGAAGAVAGASGRAGTEAADGTGGAAGKEAAPRCGDGTLDPGEKCDGNCPSSCPAPKGCMGSMLTGSSSTCDAECMPMTITAAKPGDGCCPEGASAATDTDCPASCGDGIVQANETCEAKSTSKPCPTVASCDDGDACTKESVSGSVAQCNAECTHTPITAAKSGDGCCPMGKLKRDDSDCTAECSVPDDCGSPIECHQWQCRSGQCMSAVAASSGCSGGGTCQADGSCKPKAACGNGTVDPGEECDPLAPGWAGACSSTTCRRQVYTTCPCENGAVCQAGVCMYTCTQDANCDRLPSAKTPKCWPIQGGGESALCALPCSADGECPMGLVCRTFLDVPRGQAPISWQYCATAG